MLRAPSIALWTLGLLLAGSAAPVRADEPTDPRALARAGATLTSDSGSTALLRNPASLAHDAALRLQLGLSSIDVDSSVRPRQELRTLTNQAAPHSAPTIGLAYGWDRLILGAIYAEAAGSSLRLPEPAFGQSVAEVTTLFPHRYGGVALRHRIQRFDFGGAFRVTPWLAVGASAGVARIRLSETRYLWAGYQSLGEVYSSPQRDLRLTMSGSADLVPQATLGLLLAPPPFPVLIAVSGSYRGTTRIRGSAAMDAAHAGEYPAVKDGHSTAACDLPAEVTLRSGGRYNADRWAVELGAELHLVTDDAPAVWRTELAVQHSTELPPVPLRRVPALYSRGDHVVGRSAVEVEVVPSFLWLTAGYAYHTAAGHRAYLAPVAPQLSSHTFAVGAEGYWSQFTVTLGYSRRSYRATEVSADSSRVFTVNPFGGGSGSAGAGHYDRADDLVGLSLSVGWDPALTDSD